VTRAVLASSNPGKLRELATLLAPFSLQLIAQGDFGIHPAAETGSTFIENALLKAHHAARHAHLAALADDSGLEVDALGGRPGVWSARFAGAGASDEQNLRQLLAELEDVPDGYRQARYQCVIVWVRSVGDQAPLIAHGTWEGRIGHAPHGQGGFGYDPVFVPAGEQRTAAQLSDAEKNAVSHRGQALRAIVAMLGAASYIRAP
jgi:XTP/dITP diphosphohydrolase